jgi:hypothetical protein
MEGNNIVQSTYGPMVDSYNDTYTYNGVTNSWNFSNPLGYDGYQASRASGIVKSFLSPLDYSAQGVSSPASYLANNNVIASYYNFNKITDGLSNTMFYAEGLTSCQRTVTYSYNFGTPFTDTETYGGQRIWNYDPYNTTYTSTYSYTDNSSTSTSSSNMAPTFSSYGSYDPSTSTSIPFQQMPLPTACDDNAAQGLSSGGLLVAMGDGSIRGISPSITLTTFTAAGTPNSGDQLGSDW